MLTELHYALKELIDIANGLSPNCSQYKLARTQINEWMHRHLELVEQIQQAIASEEPWDEPLVAEVLHLEEGLEEEDAEA